VGQNRIPKIAYLSQATLYLKDGEGEARRVDSCFGQKLRERAVQIRQRSAWKTQGPGAGFLSGGMLWGAVDDDPAGVRVAVRGVGRGRSRGEILYAIDTGEVSGVFALRDFGAEEQRLFHSNDLRVDHLCAAPGDERIACSVAKNSGVANLALMEADGSDLREVTEGDSVDVAPSWVPGGSRSLIFQSAGVGRDTDGNPVALGPFCIERLDLEQGGIDRLVEDPAFDFLTPRVADDGALLYIRRPYRGQPEHSHLRALLDFLMLPIRLLETLFHYLNFVSTLYTGKRLTSAGGPGRQGPELKQMMLWGKLIDAEKAARLGRLRGEDAPALVPRSWELVRRDPSGETRVLARGVLAFDLAGDGSVVYSNGSAVECLSPAGDRERICTAAQIEHLIVME
jgi:hypothetical protein